MYSNLFLYTSSSTDSHTTPYVHVKYTHTCKYTRKYTRITCILKPRTCTYVSGLDLKMWKMLKNASWDLESTHCYIRNDWICMHNLIKTKTTPLGPRFRRVGMIGWDG